MSRPAGREEMGIEEGMEEKDGWRIVVGSLKDGGDRETREGNSYHTHEEFIGYNLQLIAYSTADTSSYVAPG